MATERVKLARLYHENGGEIIVTQNRLDYVDGVGAPDKSQGHDGRDWELVVVLDGRVLHTAVYLGDDPGRRMMAVDAGIFIQRDVPDALVAAGTEFDDLVPGEDATVVEERDQARAAAREKIRELRRYRHDIANFIGTDGFGLLGPRLRGNLETIHADLTTTLQGLG